MKDIFLTLVASCMRMTGSKSPESMYQQKKREGVNISRPLRLPNLTPCDYFLWGHIKNKVYDRNHENTNDVKTGISNCFHGSIVRNAGSSIWCL